MKLTEEQRRRNYSRKMSIVSFVSMGLFLILLIIGFAAHNIRECADRQALEAAVCVDCADAACMDCRGGSKECRLCEKGYVLSPNGKCVDCDSESFVECESCTLGENDQTQCTKCAIGHRLEGEKCVLCDELLTCNSCTD